MHDQQRVLILAPAGRDAHLAASVLEQAGIPSDVCSDTQSFTEALRAGPAVGLLTEQVLTHQLRACLKQWLDTQPLWSDFPLVLLAAHPTTAASQRRLALVVADLGNITVLDRPLHPEIMVSAVRAALRARGRQYEARELLCRLKEAIRERDQFLAILSHELRNPLGAIRNAAELMARGVSGDSAFARPLAIMERQTKHLARLVDDLLDVSRVTTGKITLHRRACDLAEVIRRAVQQVEVSAAEHGLGIRTWFCSRPPMVDIDSMRIEQVFVNLLTNAIKYTPREGTIDVKVEADGAAAIVRVADTGVGIGAEMLPSIFKMFVQEDRSLDRSQGGMGIGLTLVRNLVELHGGTVSAASAGPGRGSTFTVVLPLAASTTAVSGEASPVEVERPRRHVLIVEDSADNRDMLHDLLELDGYRVDVAMDGLEGVDRGLTLRPDIAIIDIGLPGIDGYQVAERLRAQLGDAIILVALTGYGRPEDRQKAAQAGFDRHLVKPVRLPELEAVLHA